MSEKKNTSLIYTPLFGIPEIHPGDPLDEIILEASSRQGVVPEDGDIYILAQKVVSKAENRFFNYAKLEVSEQAAEIAKQCGKDPQFVELVLSEAKSVVRVAPGLLIVEHKSGFISANAGIDHSNVKKQTGEQGKWALLLPKNADESAEGYRSALQTKTGKNLGVLIIDSHGRPWRYGTVGITIGIAGVPALVDMRGKTDLYGRILEATVIAAADEVAAGASLVMGQTDEAIPIVHVRGFPYPLGEGKLRDMIRSKENDLFR